MVVLSFFKFANKKAEGEEEIQKKQISGFYERKKEEVLTRREGDEKKRKNLQKQTILQKFVLPPSFLGERECACVRVCDRDAATTKIPAGADDPKQSSDDE